MTRPDFYEGLHPQLDCDLANKRKLEYMTELEDSLNVAATSIAALAQANVRLEHEMGHERDVRRNAEKIADDMKSALDKRGEGHDDEGRCNRCGAKVFP